MNWIKSKVVMLPSKEVSGLLLNRTTNILSLGTFSIHPDWKTQYLYFTSDEEIKEGDWVIGLDTLYIGICTSVNERYVEYKHFNTKKELFETKSPKGIVKKLVASTDKFLGWSHLGNDEEGHLIGNSSTLGNGCIFKPILPEPSKEFLEVYVKAYNEGKKIEEVMIKIESYSNESEQALDWRIKVKPDNTITIKKVKDSWSREEVIRLCNKAWLKTPNIPNMLEEFDKWIEQNL